MRFLLLTLLEHTLGKVGGGLTDKQHHAPLEPFRSDVAPAVRPLEGR